jgi:hypothetical protein
LDAVLVRPSLSVFDAAEAAFAEVTLLGAFRCERALPPAALDLVPVDPLRIVFDAAVAARRPVTFDFAIPDSLLVVPDWLFISQGPCQVL